MDKLIKVPTQTIPAFINFYKAASYPKHANTYSAFKSYLIQAERFPEMKENLELFSLNGEWEKDGLFLLKNGASSYYFDSVEPQPFDRLSRLLHLIDYKQEVVFRAVRDQFKPAINELLWLKNLEITDQTGTTTYCVPKEIVRKLPEPQAPDGWVLRRLTMDDIEQVNQQVHREGGDNLNYVANSIKYKDSFGLFDEAGKPQGWIFGVDIGTLGTVGVGNDHKHKGGGSALAVYIAKIMAKDYDMDTLWNVNHGNDFSHGLARKFQAKNVGTVTWMAVNQRVTKKMTQMGMYQIYYPKL